MYTELKWGYDPDGNKVGISCKINGVIGWVPKNENNIDYQAIQEWVAEGNTIEE